MLLKYDKNVTRNNKIDMLMALVSLGLTCRHTDYGDLSVLWWMRHIPRFALNMMPLTLRCWCWPRWAALEMTYVAINPFIRLCRVSNIHGTICMKFTGWMGHDHVNCRRNDFHVHRSKFKVTRSQKVTSSTCCAWIISQDLTQYRIYRNLVGKDPCYFWLTLQEIHLASILYSSLAKSG